MEVLNDPEEKMLCPYNSAHYIRKFQMNTHLVKCRQNYPNSKLVECDFNVNHRIPKPELQYHHENCPDRRKIETAIFVEEGTDVNRFPIPNIHVPTEESWDDYNVPAYDPKKYCEQKEIIRHVDVEPPSVRKNFRVQERKRLNELTANKPGSSSVKENVNKKGSMPKKGLPEKTKTSLAETTPASVEDVLKRISIGKNKPFVPKDD